MTVSPVSAGEPGHRRSRELLEVVAAACREQREPPELGPEPEGLAARRPLEEAARRQGGGEPRRRRLVHAERTGELGHAELLLRRLERLEQLQRAVDSLDAVAHIATC